MNIRCSKRCAKPVRPGRSRAEPTWYQMFTADDRHAVVLVEDHVQAVGQRELGVRQLDLARAPRRRRATGWAGAAAAGASASIRTRTARFIGAILSCIGRAASATLCVAASFVMKYRAMAEAAPLVGVIMGSKSDWETMRQADEILTRFGVPHECRIVSAHRTPGVDGRVRGVGGGPRPRR